MRRGHADYRAHCLRPCAGVLGGRAPLLRARCEACRSCSQWRPPVSPIRLTLPKYDVRASMNGSGGPSAGPDEYRRLGYRAVFGVIARKNFEQYRRIVCRQRRHHQLPPTDACDSCKALAAAALHFDKYHHPEPRLFRDWLPMLLQPMGQELSRFGDRGMPERKRLADAEVLARQPRARRTRVVEAYHRLDETHQAWC